MRAHTITTMSRRRRQARRRSALALALGVCALAIPATASAEPAGDYSSVNAITGGSSDSSEANRSDGSSNVDTGADRRGLGLHLLRGVLAGQVGLGTPAR